MVNTVHWPGTYIKINSKTLPTYSLALLLSAFLAGLGRHWVYSVCCSAHVAHQPVPTAKRKHTLKPSLSTMSGPSQAGGPGGHVPPHFLADQLTLSQPGGAHYPHTVVRATPDFQTLRRPCIVHWITIFLHKCSLSFFFWRY